MDTVAAVVAVRGVADTVAVAAVMEEEVAGHGLAEREAEAARA